MTEIQMKVTLRGISPPIWRRIRCSSAMSLFDLHNVIQISFGWTNSHLFIIEIESMKFVHTPHWEEDAYQYQSAELAVLSDLIPQYVTENETFTYLYDLGDSWSHEVQIERIDSKEKINSIPVCVSGARACPPEDVGGTMGYQEFLKAISDPKTTQHEEMLVWIGPDYNPEAIDLDVVNRKLNDYYQLSQLSSDSWWNREVEYFLPTQYGTNLWSQNLSFEQRNYAENLAFRRDVVTMMQYLQEHNVKGTKALGNFPRKHIRGITAGFVNPPDLDLQIGERVFQLRSEDEVSDLIFMHHFINTADLINGGENMQWKVTYSGEKFLEQSPENQVWLLNIFWWYRFNWAYCYQYDNVELKIGNSAFQRNVSKLLLSYPKNKPIEITRFVKDFDVATPNWIRIDHDKGFYKKRYLENVIVKPFEKLGLLETLKEQVDYFPNMFLYENLIMTEFGASILKYF